MLMKQRVFYRFSCIVCGVDVDEAKSVLSLLLYSVWLMLVKQGVLFCCSLCTVCGVDVDEPWNVVSLLLYSVCC